MPDKEVGPVLPSAGAPELDAEFAELVRSYDQISYPNVRAALFYLMIMAPHMDTKAALELIEEYFPLADMIREYEGA